MHLRELGISITPCLAPHRHQPSYSNVLHKCIRPVPTSNGAQQANISTINWSIQLLRRRCWSLVASAGRHRPTACYGAPTSPPPVVFQSWICDTRPCRVSPAITEMPMRSRHVPTNPPASPPVCTSAAGYLLHRRRAQTAAACAAGTYQPSTGPVHAPRRRCGLLRRHGGVHFPDALHGRHLQADIGSRTVRMPRRRRRPLRRLHRPVRPDRLRSGRLPALHRPVRMPRRRRGPLRRLHRPVGPDRLLGRHLPAIHRPVTPASTPTPATTSPPPASRTRRHARPGAYNPDTGSSPPASTPTRRPPRRLNRVHLPDGLRHRHLPAIHRPVRLPRRRRGPPRRLHRPVGHQTSPAARDASATSHPPARREPTAGQSASTPTPGHYAPTTGQSAQTPCAAGTYNPDTGSSDASACLDADAGHYVGLNRPVGPDGVLRGRHLQPRGRRHPLRPAPRHPPLLDADADYVAQPVHLPATRHRPVRLPRRRRGPLRRLHRPVGPGRACGATYKIHRPVRMSRRRRGPLRRHRPVRPQTACATGLPSTPPPAPPLASTPTRATTSPPPASRTRRSARPGAYQPSTGQSGCLDADAGHYVDSTASTSPRRRAQRAPTRTPPGRPPAKRRRTGTTLTWRGPRSTPPAPPAPTSHPPASPPASTPTRATTSPQPRPPPRRPAPPAPTSHPPASPPASTPTRATTSTPTGQSEQIACHVGTYNPVTGSISVDACILADPGYKAYPEGSAQQTACLPGTYQPSSGQSTCVNANPGYFVSNYASTSQSPCQIGQYQPSSSQSSCLFANTGHYVPVQAQENQSVCSQGTFQPLTGQSDCLEADPGHYVDSTASPSQSPCPAGTYQPLAGQSSCVDASAGHYVGPPARLTRPPARPAPTSRARPRSPACRRTRPLHGLERLGFAGPCQLGALPAAHRPVRLPRGRPRPLRRLHRLALPVALPGRHLPAAGRPVLVRGRHPQATTSHPPARLTRPPARPAPTSRARASVSCMSTDPGHYTDSNASVSQDPASSGTTSRSPASP